MPKKKQTVFDDLLREVPKEILALAERIGQLKNTIEAKRARMEQLAEDIAAKQQQVEVLREESRQAMADGADPGRNAKLVRQLKDEIELLQDLLPDSPSVDPAASEKKELEQLKRDMTGLLHSHVRNSQTKQIQEQRFNEVAANMVELRHEWEQACEGLHSHFEVAPHGINTLHINDKQVARDVAWHFGRSI